MDFRKVFERIDPSAETKARNEIEQIVKGNNRFSNLKKRATKSPDRVIDFLDYVYNVYKDQIDQLAKRYGMTHEEIAGIFISM
jgi:hypothetical protein